MVDLNLSEAVMRSNKIRELYRRLEIIHHQKEWTVTEDVLAFLTDAGLVGRLTMSQQGRWPTKGATPPELAHKLAECMWWLIVLAERMDIDITSALEKFLLEAEQNLME